MSDGFKTIIAQDGVQGLALVSTSSSYRLLHPLPPLQ
jgi:hypothetical protein